MIITFYCLISELILCCHVLNTIFLYISEQWVFVVHLNSPMKTHFCLSISGSRHFTYNFCAFDNLAFFLVTNLICLHNLSYTTALFNSIASYSIWCGARWNFHFITRAGRIEIFRRFQTILKNKIIFSLEPLDVHQQLSIQGSFTRWYVEQWWQKNTILLETCSGCAILKWTRKISCSISHCVYTLFTPHHISSFYLSFENTSQSRIISVPFNDLAAVLLYIFSGTFPCGSALKYFDEPWKFQIP